MTDRSTWTRPFVRMSTGQKVLLLLGLALLPLGLIAFVSSVETARAAQESRDNTASLLAEVSAARLSNAIARTAIGLRAASTAVAIDGPQSARCAETLSALAALEQYDVRFAIFDADDEAICTTPGFAPRAMEAPRDGGDVITRLDTDNGTIRFVVAGANRRSTGVAELTAETLRRLTRPDKIVGPYRITVSQEDRELIVHSWGGNRQPDNIRRAQAEIASGQILFTAQFAANPLRFSEALAIVLPVLMWLAAAFFGWLAVDRMVVLPLTRLRGAIVRYGRDGGEFQLPQTRTPATEIRDLGHAFQRTVEALQDNERKLEAGLAEQRRLTREVHHRVKNNLQVVASLLSLHARSAVSEETAAAYASIQRRVDALAIVQRNLFAEGDAEKGVAIRPVISELATGLQQGAPSSVSMAITIELASVRVAQDIAVPVAFFITELVELAMTCAEDVAVEIRLGPPDADGLAELSVRSPALEKSEEEPAYPRYRRVLTGLARQLRTNIEQSEDKTRSSVRIPTI
ncbi:MAG: sensor histidine kinase [Parasphingopyxis sp.]|nr:hypothetical protein [Sphingomonadales bacterium]